MERLKLRPFGIRVLYDSVNLAKIPFLAGARREHFVALCYKGWRFMGVKDGARWGIIGHEFATGLH